MKLDRNINEDGKGKYALLNLRRNTVEWSGFFVIKYKDRFAGAALRAYAQAVRDYAGNRGEDERPSLLEYAAEIEHEANIADAQNNKKTPD